MKKIICFIFLILLGFTMISCDKELSEQEQAKLIYNNPSLSVFQKIDELNALYAKLSNANKKHDSMLNDAAWNALERGDYDLALGLIDAKKGSAGGAYAEYYITLLQVDLPAPTAIYIEIVKDYNNELKWTWGYTYPEGIQMRDGKYNVDILYHKINIDVKNGASYEFESTDRDIFYKKTLSKDENGKYQDLNMTIEFTACPGMVRTYYKDTLFTYTFSLSNINESKIGKHYINL